MANAAKRMKEKKAVQLEKLLKAKGGFVEESVVEEKVDEVVEIDTGTVTSVDVVDGEPVDAPTDEYTEEELNEMTKGELQDIAEELGLDTDGKKAELIERILNA